MPSASILLDKIAANTEILGIIGLEYVGLQLAVGFAQAGKLVIGFDKSQDQVDLINRGKNYIKDICDALLSEAVEKFALTATTDFSGIRECDALLICGPTPPDKFCNPDMSYIESVCVTIGQHMKSGTFISLESTTYPTSTEELMITIIEKESGMKHGEDFWLTYSHERVDQENPSFHRKNTTKEGLEIREKIYSKAIEHLQLANS
jgi:UDP-N-acetyl-D-glucosamine dehydrogenase